MFYALLDSLVCPTCRTGLTLMTLVERAQSTAMRMPPARRVPPPDALVGPLPGGTPASRLAALLAPLASPPARDGRDTRVAVVEGILVCAACERWYPVRQGLPELLPDHLRDWREDREWLAARRAACAVPGLGPVWSLLEERTTLPVSATDEGAHHKLAEISVTRRALPADFFRWADVAPFNRSNPACSFDLLARYLTTASRLGCGVNGVVFDLGCGTGWTSEWLVRLGYQAIGVDLCRDYVLAGMSRRGEHLPHFVVADVENIPLRDGAVDATLSFDAFHHVPDRPKALRELARIMRPGTTMVLTEPGIEHEHAAVSVDVMREHGILERGFDEAGLAGYIEGLPFEDLRRYRSDTHPHDVYSIRRRGTYETDSLAPRALVAGIEPDPPAGSVRAGQPPELAVTITNRGDTTWLCRTPDENGEVHLGAQLYDSGHCLLAEDYARVKLPQDVRPGESIRLRCAFPPVRRPGEYMIQLDMIDAGYLWFKDYAYQPVPWNVSVTGNALGTADDPLVAEWPARIEPEQLTIPPSPEGPPPATLPPVPAPASRWRGALAVWRRDGPAGFAARILRDARRRLIG